MFALLMLAQLSADPTPADQAAWRSCLNRTVLRLERTKEAPHDVALGALEACKPSEPAMSIGLRMRLHEAMTDKLAGRVVEIRSCKMDRRCNPSAIPW